MFCIFGTYTDTRGGSKVYSRKFRLNSCWIQFFTTRIGKSTHTYSYLRQRASTPWNRTRCNGISPLGCKIWSQGPRWGIGLSLSHQLEQQLRTRRSSFYACRWRLFSRPVWQWALNQQMTPDQILSVSPRLPDCTPTPSTLAQSKEWKGSNFAAQRRHRPSSPKDQTHTI